MTEDKEGFLYPEIDPMLCTGCGECKDVCPIINIDSIQLEQHNIATYAGYLDDGAKLRSCASGGIATAISEKFIDQGGVVFGVEYSDHFRASRYAYAEKREDLERFKGSKYIQSRKEDMYKRLQAFLDEGRDVLFIGLPCDVGAVKLFLQKEYSNLYTAELICYGATSPKVAKQYINTLEKKYNSQVEYVTVRYKKNGWTPIYFKANFHNGKTFLRQFNRTDYGIAFHELSRSSCLSCVYKGDKRVADITIGDFWGVTSRDSCWNTNGVSIICLHTAKGNSLLEKLQGYSLFDVEYSRAAKGNPCMIKPRPDTGRREAFSNMLVNQGLSYACKKIIPRKAKIRNRIAEIKGCMVKAAMKVLGR